MLENENNIIDSEIIDESLETTQEIVDKSPKKKEKKPKSKIRRIIGWVITGVFGVLIAFSAAILIYSQLGGDGFVGNYMFPVVLTDSMGDVYPVGSVLIVEKVDPADVKVGDNVTFKYDITPSDGIENKVNMTHQISNIEYDPQWVGQVGSGYYKFTAHGTNKHSEFCKIGGEYGDCTNQLQHFREYDLVGRVVRVSPTLTVFYKFVKSPFGLVILILVPCMYLMVTSVIDLFKKIPDDEPTPGTAGSGGGTSGGDYKPKVYAPGENPLAGMSEEDKERLKKQLLDEMLGKGGKK